MDGGKPSDLDSEHLEPGLCCGLAIVSQWLTSQRSKSSHASFMDLIFLVGRCGGGTFKIRELKR